MKSILGFIRATLTGGIIFLLPLALILVILSKIMAVISKLASPLASRMPDLAMGLDGSRLLTIFILIALCFLAGILFRLAIMRRMVGKLEDSVLVYLPGYYLLKSITADAVGAKIAHHLDPVMIKDGDTFVIGFLSEEKNGYAMVYIPEVPKHDSGELRIFPSSSIIKLKAPVNLFARSLKNYGTGILEHIQNDEELKKHLNK